MFDLNSDVMTPKGKGKVVYVEDGYIEVDVDGAEISFSEPFTGLSAYDPNAEAAAPKVLRSDTALMAADSEPTPEWDKALLEVSPAHLRAGEMHQMRHAADADAGTRESAATWDNLNSFEKLTYVQAAGGSEPDVYLNMTRADAFKS
jgi:hypothetical protein